MPAAGSSALVLSKVSKIECWKVLFPGAPDRLWFDESSPKFTSADSESFAAGAWLISKSLKGPTSVPFEVALSGLARLPAVVVFRKIEVSIRFAESRDTLEGEFDAFDAMTTLSKSRVPFPWDRHRPRHFFGDTAAAMMAAAAPATYVHECWPHELDNGKPVLHISKSANNID